MATIHVIRAEDGEVLTAMPALTALYDVTGMGWLFKLAKLPVLSGAAEIAYKMVSKNRQSMGAAADGLLALGRINMEEKGEGSCTDLEGECREKPPPVDEEAEAAEAAAVERRAKLAAEKSAAAEAKAKVAKKPVSTSAGDWRMPPGSLLPRRAAPSLIAATSSACTTSDAVKCPRARSAPLPWTRSPVNSSTR